MLPVYTDLSYRPNLFPCGSLGMSVSSLYSQLLPERVTPPISLGFIIAEIVINLAQCLCIIGYFTGHVYPSSTDEKVGAQRNSLTCLRSQL